jgi:hypothetical protein
VWRQRAQIEVARSFHNQGRTAPTPVLLGHATEQPSPHGISRALLLLGYGWRNSRERARPTQPLDDPAQQDSGNSMARVIESARAMPTTSTCSVTQRHSSAIAKTALQGAAGRGHPCSWLLTIEQEPFLKQTLNSRSFRHIYSDKEIKALENATFAPRTTSFARKRVDSLKTCC